MIKKIFAIAIIAMGIGTSATFAQTTNTTKPLVEAKGIKLNPTQDAVRQDFNGVCDKSPSEIRVFKGISLTSEQKEKLRKLDDKSAKNRDKQKDKARKERTKMMQERDKQIKKILTPEQYEQYKANQKAFKGERKSKVKKYGKNTKRHGRNIRTGKHGHKSNSCNFRSNCQPVKCEQNCKPESCKAQNCKEQNCRPGNCIRQ